MNPVTQTAGTLGTLPSSQPSPGEAAGQNCRAAGTGDSLSWAGLEGGQQNVSVRSLAGVPAEQSEPVAERAGKAGLLDREGLLVFFWLCTPR